jgi:DNA-binding SARP family transcriptional activator/TolB-like protein
MVNSDSSIEIRPLPRWSLRLLGGFDLQGLSTDPKMVLPGKRERALLAFLALSPKGRQPRRKLAALLWGDATDETLLDNLRTCVWRLRKALGHGAHSLLASEDEDIVLDLTAFDIDVLTFRRLAQGVRRAELEHAARLLHGDFLDGLGLDSEEFESWRRLEASRHLDQAVDVLSRLMRLYADSAETERAIEVGGKILGLDPLNEAAARRMMRLYANSGRRGAALQLYHALAEDLKREVNAQPEAATKQVFAVIAHAEQEAATPETSAETSIEAPVEISSNPARDAPPPETEPRPVHRWRLRLAALAAALILIAALASYWRPAPTPPAAAPRAAAASSPAAMATANKGTPVTIAVLPFDNQSGNAGLASFSDGIAGEISTSLEKVPGLKLVMPGAALQLNRTADRNLLVTPGVRYLVEGTVRLTQKQKVNVVARLIRTDTGASLWSESYDRELTDISTVRTDIAMAIAEALKAPLGLDPGTDSAPGSDIDPQSYQQFLRATVLMRGRYTGMPEAIKILEPLVQHNPSYAPAWASLAYCYATIPGFVSPYDMAEKQRRIQLYFPLAKQAADRAIALDPKLAEPYLVLARMAGAIGGYAAEVDLLSKALALDPDSTDALHAQMNLYANVGYRKKALAVAERLQPLAPDNVGLRQDIAEIHWENGETDGPIAVLKSLTDRPSGPTSLAMMYASVGRYNDAADVLETALKGPGGLPGVWPPQFRIAAALLRKAPSKTAFPPDFPPLDHVGFVYLYVGAPAHAIDNYEQWLKGGQKSGQGFNYVWNASYAPARKTESFKQFVRDAGFVDYWRMHGWPDLCHPVGADDFACD